VICVGTTAVRTVESAANADGTVSATSGETSIFLYPGVPFRITDGLLTNFHWPQSSLILLVSAFYGRENTLAAYHEAIQNNMMLFSYGDGMLIL
jgi:S-adenosylmethionine:tRNA ribosyltransferase-isomerase